MRLSLRFGRRLMLRLVRSRFDAERAVLLLGMKKDFPNAVALNRRFHDRRARGPIDVAIDPDHRVAEPGAKRRMERLLREIPRLDAVGVLLAGWRLHA